VVQIIILPPGKKYVVVVQAAQATETSADTKIRTSAKILIGSSFPQRQAGCYFPFQSIRLHTGHTFGGLSRLGIHL